jgi:8-hydroxy-5-deazaflavin:NADPH oxidoreductase
MKIAFIGHGHVGYPLANHLGKYGHDITLAANDPRAESVRKALANNADLKVAPPKDAVKRADVIFLATPFHANEEALVAVAEELTGKILVDCTNPIGPNLTHGLNSMQSGSEMVQKLVPATRVVKAFTIYGFENFENSAYPGYDNLRPAMLIASDNADAKRIVSGFCSQLGWNPVDTGPLSMSLHLEHLTLLWIKMARAQGRGPHFTWAMLTR